MHDKQLKKYQHKGFIRDDSDFIRLRGELERLMSQEMRSEGYLPVHDLGSFWATSYSEADKRYQFVLTMFAAYVGARKAQEWDFWYAGKLVKAGEQLHRGTNRSDS